MSVEQRAPADDTNGQAAKPAARHGSGRRGLTPAQVALLDRRRKLAWAAQQAYYERSAILGKLNYWIGVPVVMVTAIAGSAIVANNSGKDPIPIWVGVITVTAAVLASLQTFFRFGERAAFSAVAGNRYAKLRRRIEDCLAFPPEGLDDRLTEIQKLEDDAGEQSPPLGERRWLRWQAFAELQRPPTPGERWRAILRPPRSTPMANRAG
ncbi:MAG TPA: SLATT domain-containing protein [Actinomycetota bacterium]